VLRDVLEPPRALHAALVSRVKIMASLDIAEKRLPQDGRLALKLGDKLVDVRVSTLPTGPGERVVLRLLDKDSAQLDLTALGMSARRSAPSIGLIREPHGIVLVTGPTGSGKTTTALRRAVAAAARHAQHDDGRGSDRVRARRRRPDAGQSEDRSRLRACAARDPAPGSRTSS
jgi:general secretion pathway protein E